ncbi:MAG: alpha/beta hydrolase, partial [Pseudomonadota bacterium]
DKRASSVFLGTSEEENSLHWRNIEAPTCLISGSLSWEYWGREVLTDGSSGHFAEGEMEQRLAHFRHAEHHWFEHSGHMVHYDEPERLTQLTQQFLERHYG